MLMSVVICVLMAAAFIFGAANGRMEAVSAASVSGAAEAVALLLRIGGNICLWSALMEVMQRSGLAAAVARLLSPLIKIIFGGYAEDAEAREAISQNMAANLLGLGSAATPAGLRAAARLSELSRRRGEKPHGAYLLIALNTASVQPLPTTVAAVRSGLGSAAPYDILPAVWLTSAVSAAAAVLAVKAFRGAEKR